MTFRISVFSSFASCCYYTHTNGYGMRWHVMTTWAGDDTSMPIQMWQNIQVGRTQAFPKSPKHKTPVNKPSCLGPCPSQVRRARTRHAIPFALFYNNIILSYSIGRADGRGYGHGPQNNSSDHLHTYIRCRKSCATTSLKCTCVSHLCHDVDEWIAATIA